MKKIIFIFILIMFTVFTFAEKVVPLPDLNKPDAIAVGQDQIYIAEGATIYIYSKDFKLKKKFGKKGEGPQEFMVAPQTQMILVPSKEGLVVSSLNKVSSWDREGNFIKENKIAGGFFNYGYRPTKSGYIGARMTGSEGSFHFKVLLFDSNLKLIKELAKLELLSNSGKINMMNQSFDFRYYQEKVYLLGRQGLSIGVYDLTGNKIATIVDKNYKPKPFTSEDEEKIREFMKKLSPAYEQIKDRMEFPKYFPAVLGIEVTGDELYVVTWKSKDSKNEIYRFSLDGKIKSISWVPFAYIDALRPLPYVINHGKIYQIYENEDSEEWELHINEIK